LKSQRLEARRLYQMSCYLCGSAEYRKRPGSVRDNPDIEVLECSECSLVYLSSFDHINEGHYENSGMHADSEPDVDAWLNETQVDDLRRYQFLKNKLTNKKIIDFGCGNGGFLELARTNAKNVIGIELEKALQSSFTTRELTVYSHQNEAIESGQKWDIITAFHVFEHLPDPRETLKALSSLLYGGGEIIVEVPSSDDVLLTLYNNESFQGFTYWSQHFFLFNAITLKKLVEQAGLRLNWVKHVQRYPLSNHLYWLVKGCPGGHKEWKFMNNKALNDQYEQQLASLGLTDTIIASISS
jgi:2-polyprenyl-3-methyl-5-hydroxy-6-metoxy-1,4-benzoquinol methylase